MAMGFKRCAFVITMFSLLAVQPAFSLESDFVSTGNSAVVVPTTTSYAGLLTHINGESFGYKFDEVAGDKNKVILHQSNNSNIFEWC